MTEMILTPAEAQAVSDAMVALNNVCGRAHVRIPRGKFDFLHVIEYEDRTITVYVGDAVGNNRGSGAIERFRCQNDFMETYGA